MCTIESHISQAWKTVGHLLCKVLDRHWTRAGCRLFSIDKSGVIRVAGDPDSDLQLDEYTLLVAAVDEGSPSLEAAVPVYVKFDPPLAEVNGRTPASRTHTHTHHYIYHHHRHFC